MPPTIAQFARDCFGENYRDERAVENLSKYENLGIGEDLVDVYKHGLYELLVKSYRFYILHRNRSKIRKVTGRKGYYLIDVMTEQPYDQFVEWKPFKNYYPSLFYVALLAVLYTKAVAYDKIEHDGFLSSFKMRIDDMSDMEDKSLQRRRTMIIFLMHHLAPILIPDRLEQRLPEDSFIHANLSNQRAIEIASKINAPSIDVIINGINDKIREMLAPGGELYRKAADDFDRRNGLLNMKYDKLSYTELETITANGLEDVAKSKLCAVINQFSDVFELEGPCLDLPKEDLIDVIRQFIHRATKRELGIIHELLN